MESENCEKCPLKGLGRNCHGEVNRGLCEHAGSDSADRHIELRSAVAEGWEPPVPEYVEPMESPARLTQSARTEDGGCGCGERSSYPSILTQAGNLAKSVAKHIADGFSQVSEEEKERRLSICGSCPRLLDSRCLECGCFVSVKASWQSEECPLGKWASEKK